MISLILRFLFLFPIRYGGQQSEVLLSNSIHSSVDGHRGLQYVADELIQKKSVGKDDKYDVKYAMLYIRASVNTEQSTGKVTI